MPEKIVIIILYGPYESNGIIRHRRQKLLGLIECLRKETNLNVSARPSPHLNRITIHMLKREIFHGDIRELPFNCSCGPNKLHSRIVKTVKEHLKRMTAPTNVPRFPYPGMFSQQQPPKKPSDYPSDFILPRFSLHPEDVCAGTNYGYFGYDLCSDLEASYDDKEQGTETESGSSGSSESYITWDDSMDECSVCDTGYCVPACPPGSLATGVPSEDFDSTKDLLKYLEQGGET